MNLGKKYGWDNIPYREIFLSIGTKIGVLINGTDVEIYEEKEE